MLSGSTSSQPFSRCKASSSLPRSVWAIGVFALRFRRASRWRLRHLHLGHRRRTARLLSSEGLGGPAKLAVPLRRCRLTRPASVFQHGITKRGSLAASTLRLKSQCPRSSQARQTPAALAYVQSRVRATARSESRIRASRHRDRHCQACKRMNSLMMRVIN